MGRPILAAAGFQHLDAPEARGKEPLTAPRREFGLLKTKGFRSSQWRARFCAEAQCIEPETLLLGVGGFLMTVDPGGKLWSKPVWCLVPVFQHDFGCCDALIGGESALKKARPDPAGESVVSFASRAEPGSEKSDLRSMTWQSVRCPLLND